MSDIFVPGISSRFNTQQMVEGLMNIERIPRDRAERNVERLSNEREYWQDVGRRITALRDSSRQLFGFQNPFSDRAVRSSDDMVITGTAVREAPEQERSFTVRQLAQSDRFLSQPLDVDFQVEAGTFRFTVGDEEVSFDFRGGTLREFTDALNRRGGDLVRASLITVRPGTTSLLIESRVTGEENRLNFSGAALTLGEQTGMVARANDSRRNFSDGILSVNAGSSSEIPINFQAPPGGNWILQLDVSTALRPEAAIPSPPPGPSIPQAGSISHGGIVIQNYPSTVPLPPWTPPQQPQRVDNMGVLSISFSDGTRQELPLISDSAGFNAYRFDLSVFAQGRTIVSLNVTNNNTHRDISLQNVQIFDPAALGGVRPLNAVSTAQDAIVAMEGIEVRRPTNEIDDLVPGVTITARGVSDRPVRLFVEPDREGVKTAIINFVGNYNRLMAEINILTRNDPRILDELTYLTRDEREEMRQRLGAFSGDTTLNQLRNSLMRIVSSPFPTSDEQNLALLAQIGIGTDVRRGGAGAGFDASRMRGYLEIDERVLDAAIANQLPAMRQLFASNTLGEILPNTGVAFLVDSQLRPFVETGGIISQKTSNMNSRIAQETRRVETMDRQLAIREADLRRQYSMMESAFERMERMSTSLDRFSQQNFR